MLLILSLLAQVQAAAPPPPKADADKIVEKVQKYYDATRDLRARFDQTLESAIGGRAKKASGEVWLKKPGKMRWDYEKPEKKVMVADGQVLWVYEAEDQQAIKQPLQSSTLPAQVSFLLGEGKLKEEFDATVLKQSGDDVTLKLVPKAATAAYRYLTFLVDAKTGQVKETVIYDQQGGTNKLAFSALEQNRGVDDAKFKFSPPPGTRIVSPP